MIDNELISMVSLLDDPDADVRSALDERLRERCPEVTDDLRRLLSSSHALSARQRESVSARLVMLGRENVFRELSSMKDDADPSLPDAFCLLSSLVTPDLDRDAFMRRVNDLGAGIISEINEKQTAVEQVEIFNHLFHHRFGFRADESPRVPASRYLIPEILKSGTGTPVSIMLVYFMLARSADIGLYPMCVDGGLAPVMVENGRILFYIDLKNGGGIVTDSSFYAGVYHTFHDRFSLEIRNDDLFVRIYAQTLLAFCSDRDSAPYLEKVLENFT